MIIYECTDAGWLNVVWGGGVVVCGLLRVVV